MALLGVIGLANLLEAFDFWWFEAAHRYQTLRHSVLAVERDASLRRHEFVVTFRDSPGMAIATMFEISDNVLADSTAEQLRGIVSVQAERIAIAARSRCVEPTCPGQLIRQGMPEYHAGCETCGGMFSEDAILAAELACSTWNITQHR